MNYQNYLHICDMMEDRYACDSSINRTLSRMNLTSFDKIRSSGTNYLIDNRVLLFWVIKKNFTKSEHSIVQNIFQHNSKNIDLIIAIAKFENLTTIRRFSNIPGGKRIEFFTPDELFINPVRNTISPSYQKINKDQLTDYKAEHFKILSDTDRAARHLGLVVGDIVKVMNKGDTKFNITPLEIDYFTITS